MSLELFQNWLENPESLPVSKDLEKNYSSFNAEENIGQYIYGQNTIGSGVNAPSEVMVGKELDEAIKAGDKEKTIELLTNSIGSATTSILGLAKKRSGWNPLDPDSDQNRVDFQKFVEDILKVPLFAIIQSETTNVNYEEENFNLLIDKITDLYGGATPEDKDKIKTSITSIINLAKACTDKVNTKNTKILFVQNTLDANDDTIGVIFVNTVMMMEYSHETGKYKVEAKLYILKLSFNKKLWNKDFATKLANKFILSWNKWIRVCHQETAIIK